MINTLIPILLVSAILVWAPSGLAEQYVLVKNGVAQCAIVLPQDATASMEYGARDVSHHLQLMSGAEVAIHRQKSDADLPGGYAGLIVLTHKPAAQFRAIPGTQYQIIDQVAEGR